MNRGLTTLLLANLLVGLSTYSYGISLEERVEALKDHGSGPAVSYGAAPAAPGGAAGGGAGGGGGGGSGSGSGGGGSGSGGGSPGGGSGGGQGGGNQPGQPPNITADTSGIDQASKDFANTLKSLNPTDDPLAGIKDQLKPASNGNSPYDPEQLAKIAQTNEEIAQLQRQLATITTGLIAPQIPTGAAEKTAPPPRPTELQKVLAFGAEKAGGQYATQSQGRGTQISNIMGAQAAQGDPVEQAFGKDPHNRAMGLLR